MRAAQVDGNQSEIVAAFRAMGCTVQLLHRVGEGCPDLLVGCSGINLLCEVKDPRKPPSARKLNERQQRWHGEWRGQRCVVETVDDVAALVNATRRAYNVR